MIQIPRQNNVELMNETVAALAIKLAGHLQEEATPDKVEALASLVKAVNIRQLPNIVVIDEEI